MEAELLRPQKGSTGKAQLIKNMLNQHKRAIITKPEPDYNTSHIKNSVLPFPPTKRDTQDKH